MHRDGEHEHRHQVGGHQPEQQRRTPDRGEQQPIEVAALDVDHERTGPRDAGHGEDDRDRELERLEVERPAAAAPCSATSCSAPMFTTKKKTGTMIAGMKNSGSRNTLRQRPPRSCARSWTTVASGQRRSRPASVGRAPDAVVRGHDGSCVGSWSDRRWLADNLAPVTSRKTSSRVGVRRVSDADVTPQSA